MPRTVLAFIAAVLLAAGTTAAQPATPPSGIDIGRLRAGTDSLQIYLLRRADTTHVGMLWDSIHVGEHDGAPAVHRTYRTVNRAFGPEHITAVYRLPDLAPVSVVDAGTSPSELRFRGDSVTGWFMQRGRRRTVARALDPGVYDGSAFDLMVRAGDLREGYRVSVTAFVSGIDSLATLAARVTGSERVAVEGRRRVDAWVVEMDFAGIASTLWIDKRTRALVRQVIHLAPGVSMLMDRLPVRAGDERDAC